MDDMGDQTVGWSDGRTNSRADGRTVGPSDERTNNRTHAQSHGWSELVGICRKDGRSDVRSYG